jgi:uncharacterized membrane protein YphA (DoxX/SURF4 family)
MGLKMLCRFSSDQYSIDDSLPFIANILLANVFMLSGIAIVLCYVQVKHPYPMTDLLLHFTYDAR